MSESQPTDGAAGQDLPRPSEGSAGDSGPRRSEAHVGSDGAPPTGRRVGGGGGAGDGELRPLAVSSTRVILWGELGWVLALVVILAVPSLHEGERDWWPWVPVVGLALGLFGLAYVRRGRGNAVGAR